MEKKMTKKEWQNSMRVRVDYNNMMAEFLGEEGFTVKELDAAMTETAVVTDFSIDDMWGKLPEYAEQASRLGASIKDLYGATTLYYQPGLNSQQAMSVGVETMKMARIANMDAATATEAMTAALRGFNMEINEMSATRINDVYSELAAVTAADTSQIATAMSKTVSVAYDEAISFEDAAGFGFTLLPVSESQTSSFGSDVFIESIGMDFYVDEDEIADAAIKMLELLSEE